MLLLTTFASSTSETTYLNSHYTETVYVPCVHFNYDSPYATLNSQYSSYLSQAKVVSVLSNTVQAFFLFEKVRFF